MGYHSDITIIMRKEDFKEMLLKAFWECKEVFYIIVDYYNIETVNEDVVSIYIDDVKWYDTYKEVHFVESFLFENDIPYAFERVGEEHTDIEKKSNKLSLLLSKIKE